VSDHMRWQGFLRWMKFNLVGAIGIGVQLLFLWTLTSFGLGYLLATALAVEAAVLHNFIWHERFTWIERCEAGIGSTLERLLRFNLTTGVVSIGGNLLFMRLLVGCTHLRPMLASMISIAICSVVNFAVSDRWVFRAIARVQ
jgi:putative flippase GtrA